jgi:hypothetical protein
MALAKLLNVDASDLLLREERTTASRPSRA